MINLNLAVTRWSLTDVKPVYEHSTKAVYAAVSALYGPVILKIDLNHAQLASEHRMLSGMQGKHCCQVYDFDEEQGLLLEERILPGNVLRELANLEERIEAFCQVFTTLHLSENSKTTTPSSHPTYLDWLSRIRAFSETHSIDARLQEMTQRAYDCCSCLFEKYPERVLLHGDLHHDNMLLRSDGSYAMIDPKGVVGPAILDLPRFLLNELFPNMPTEPISHMEKAIRLISEKCGYPAEDVQKAFFMETVLANMWSVQDNDPADWQELEVASQTLFSTSC